VNWTIAKYVFGLHFSSATDLSCRESNAHDTDRTVLSGLAWWCELGIKLMEASLSYREKSIIYKYQMSHVKPRNGTVL